MFCDVSISRRISTSLPAGKSYLSDPASIVSSPILNGGVVAKNPNIAEPPYPASTLVTSAESGCHPFLLRVEQGGVLVVHVADPRIGCVDLQCGFRKGAEQVNGRPFHLAAVEPLVVILRTENGGHAVVDGAHSRVGLNGNDRKAL